VTTAGPGSPNRFRLLATFIAGRSVEIAEAAAGQPAYTNGHVVFVSAGGSFAEQRLEVVLQSALLGAGSLDHRMVKDLRARPGLARRYLTIEGRRVLAELADRVPLAAEISDNAKPSTATSHESLELARRRTKIADPPPWFGVIKPSLALAAAANAGTPATNTDLRFDPNDLPEPDDEDDDEPSEQSKILKLFTSPLSSQAVSEFLRKLLGKSSSPGDGPGGAEMRVGSIRRAHKAGPDFRPLPSRIRFVDGDKPGAAVGVGGALHPEWDVHNNRYRPQWCRVVTFPPATSSEVTDVAAAGVPRDDVLRRRLSRVGLGPKNLRARPDGDELDIEALIDLFVDLRSGYSRAEHVYQERRKLARNLGVLILLDASGSATDTDPDGLAVHDHQRKAAATLAVTLEDLGDRVAVYAFRSQGRHAVHLPAIKTFEQRFGAIGRARLNQLLPSGYTRLGAGVRGAGEILKNEAGTPNRLLLVLSDGFPYDDGYEGRYAEADTRKALEELRADGVACLCLSIGAATIEGAPERVFGSAGYASGPTLADLSPHMDQLFLSSLHELAGPKILRG
jgi:nitric oxide reductase NorD protein